MLTRAPLLPSADGRIVPSAERFYRTGAYARDAGNLAAAETCFGHALRLDPNYVDALCSMAAIVGDRGDRAADPRQLGAALAIAERAVRMAPANPHVLGCMATALFRANRYADASKMAMKAIMVANALKAEGQPIRDRDMTSWWHTLGLARNALGEKQEALKCFRTCLQLCPEDAAYIRKDLALVWLGTGDYPDALHAHEARWIDLHRYPVWDSGIRLWQGESLARKTIIVHHEQGAGDTIQFARFLPFLREPGIRVIAALPPALVRLFRISGLVDGIIDINDVEFPEADYHVPMMSIPAHLGMRLDTIPSTPYLRPPNEPAAILRKQTRLLIGLVWAGAAGYGADMRRSMPFEALFDLIDAPEFEFISLQKGPHAKDPADAGVGAQVPDLSERLGDFADTASAMMQCDVIISVDTAPLHLAGALGRPTIALLPTWRCWRWLGHDRHDTPWYPTMRLVSQETPGDWAGCIDRIREMLLTAEIVEQRLAFERIAA